jgi:hypothetical protein
LLVGLGELPIKEWDFKKSKLIDEAVEESCLCEVEVGIRSVLGRAKEIKIAQNSVWVI